VSGITIVDADNFLRSNPEGPETCPGLVPRLATRHRFFSHPVLCTAAWIFNPRVRRLKIVHLKESVGGGNGQFGRARDSGDRGSTEHFIHRIRGQFLQPFPDHVRNAFSVSSFRRHAMVFVFVTDIRGNIDCTY
jgi:hypothetical protein